MDNSRFKLIECHEDSADDFTDNDLTIMHQIIDSLMTTFHESLKLADYHFGGFCESLPASILLSFILNCYMHDLSVNGKDDTIRRVKNFCNALQKGSIEAVRRASQ